MSFTRVNSSLLKKGHETDKAKVYTVCSPCTGHRSAPGRPVYFRLWGLNTSESGSGLLTSHVAQSIYFSSWLPLRRNGGIVGAASQSGGKVHETRVVGAMSDAQKTLQKWCPSLATIHAQNIHQLLPVLQPMRPEEWIVGWEQTSLHPEENGKPTKEASESQEMSKSDLRSVGIEEGEVSSKQLVETAHRGDGL